MRSKNISRALFLTAVFILLPVYQALPFNGQSNTESPIRRELKSAKSDLDEANRALKESREKELVFQQEDVKRAKEQVEKVKALQAQNLANQKDVDANIRYLETAQAYAEKTKKQIAEIERSLPKLKSIQPDISQNKILPDADIILLNAKDDALIKDTIAELMNISFAEIAAENLIKERLQKAHLIVRPYCPCTDVEFQDWLNGEGLPSVVNKMKDKKLSRADAIRYQSHMDAIDRLKEYKTSKERLWDSTLQLFVDRIEGSFKKQTNTLIEKYRLEVATRQFVKLKENEQHISVGDMLSQYIVEAVSSHNADYQHAIKKLNEEAARLKQQGSAKRNIPKQKAKPKTPIRSI